jgi:hypothetical protein
MDSTRRIDKPRERRRSRVCPKWADYQWGKDPLE